MLLEDKPENENPFQEPHPGVATSVRVEQSLRFHEAEDIASIHSMSEEQEEEEEEEPLAPLLTHNTGPPLLSPLVIDDHTPEDSEGSALSDPRFSAFLIQSPYYRLNLIHMN